MDATEFFKAQLDKTAPVNYPQGKLNADDEGELAVALTHDSQHKLVLVRFPKPVHWFAMKAQEAVDLAQKLIGHATAVADEPLMLKLPSNTRPYNTARDQRD